MEMAGYPFFSDSIWTPQESDKMTEIVPSDPKLNALEGTGLRIWIGPFVYPLFWNEMTKNVKLLPNFNIFLL